MGKPFSHEDGDTRNPIVLGLFVKARCLFMRGLLVYTIAYSLKA